MVGGSESQSFEAWARASGTQLRRAALLLTGDAHDADDLVQDVMVRVFARWHRIRDMDSREGYARRVLVNRHLSIGRRLQGFRARQHVLAAEESDPDEARNATVVARRDLHRALMALGPRQRAVVVLRYYLDLPDAQIAELLECSPSTIRTQALRALAKLRQSVEIGEYDYGQER